MKNALFAISLATISASALFARPWEEPSSRWGEDKGFFREQHQSSRIGYPDRGSDPRRNARYEYNERVSHKHHYGYRRPAAVFFEHAQHHGASIALDVGEEIPDLARVFSHYNSWNDEISSINLKEGVSVILYEHSHFRGRRIKLDHSTRRLSSARSHFGSFENWNDRVSSIRVIRSNRQRERREDDFSRDRERKDRSRVGHASVVLFSDSGYSGRRLPLRAGDSIPNLSRIDWNDSISSIRMNDNLRLQLFEHSNFRGRSIVISASQYNMNHVSPDRPYGRSEGWNDRVSSLRVISSEKLSNTTSPKIWNNGAG